MACIRLCPCMGLSIYKVCRHGTSKPVSHMSRTITSFSSSSGSFIRSASMRRCSLVVWWRVISTLSEEAEVITTFIAPRLMSSECHCGRKVMIASYSSTAILRLIATIMPLPSNTSCRCSKCVTISRAMFFIRDGLPISASSCVHLAFASCTSFMFSVSSSRSSDSISFRPSSLSSTFASRLS